ncbi:periplasmic binding protein-like II [Pleomassaria siparia CBS 279.74]|uniref:Periplasmic binding protein-like II n=1 Tax=Pleomassaria siparia CBS 279.74 TaxID=1314801 RepID=A0A6G1KDF5_9PLEO|nr:periplasmic binding protein-like II [Pleomassaria siparia CBS 279.74]
MDVAAKIHEFNTHRPNMTTNTLRISLENVDFRLPTQITDDNSVTALKSLVFEPLLRWQPGGLVKPGLFDRWEHSPDGKHWHFHIRDHAVFHDGQVCSATDIVTYINGLLHSRDYFGMLWSYARYFQHATISAEDDRTVKIENPEPFADILDIFCEFWPSRLAADGKPVLGTGPYRVVEFERQNNIGKATLHRVAPTEPNHPDVIIATHEPDGEKRLKLLRNGEVDVALNLERADNLEVVNFDPSLQWGRITSSLSAMYYLNCPSGIFSSPEARLAANLAVDRTALVKQVFHGLALPAATIVSPFHLGFKEADLQPIPYDPETAKKLLSTLDISAPILLRTPQYMPEHAEKISRFVASSLEAVGFKVEITVETNRPEYAHSIGLRKEIGDLALFDSTPNSTFRVLDDKVSSESRNTWWLGYHDDETQGLIREARKKVDDGERKVAYAKCLRRVRENPPWLFVAHPDVVWAAREGVKVRIGHSGVLTLE